MDEIEVLPEIVPEVLPGQLQFAWDADDDDVTVESPERAAIEQQPKQEPMKKKSMKTARKATKTTTTKAAPADAKVRSGRKKKPTAKKKSISASRKKKSKKKSTKTPIRTASQRAATKKRVPRSASVSAAAAAESSASIPLPTNEAPKSDVPADLVPASVASASVASASVSPPAPTSEPAAMEYIPLKWGAQLPKVGFGFWKVDKSVAADVCYQAIKAGYRHLDCACDYGNEVEVGQGIQAAIRDGLCDRDDLWVTSKLWNTYHAADHVGQACQKSLDDLGLDYLDLYLIHFPIAQRFVPFEKNYPPGWFFDPDADHPVIEEARVPVSETWQAMEELAKAGLVRNIGICNFGTSQIRDLLSYAKIRPAVLQVESHPYLTQEKLLRYCNLEKIAYTAFSPLGAQSYFSTGMADPSEAVLQHKVIRDIARATGKTAAQVLLRWGVQRGTSVIPKTTRPERLRENISVFDFELTTEQMLAISALDQGRRFNDPGRFAEAAFNTFLPIYE